MENASIPIMMTMTREWRWWQRLVLGLLALSLVASPTFGAPSPPQEEKKPLGTKVREGADLVDQEPFDRIFLDDFNEKAEIDIVPLSEIPPRPYPQTGDLIFNLMDGSWPTLQVPWENVVELKTFNEMLSEEADQLIAAGNYAHAFRNLLYILDHSDPGTLRVEERIQKVLFLDGKANYDSGNYALALSIFEDLYRRNPRFQVPGISLTAIELILNCYELSLEQFLKIEEFEAIRSLLATLKEQYQGDAQPLLTKWTDKLDQLARDYLAQARQNMAQGNPRDARAFARRAINVDSQLEEAYQLFDEVIRTNPTVFVGVSQPALNPNPNRIEDWSSRRVGRLTQRRLIELVGLSEEGGRYEFINGRIIQMDQTGHKYRLQIEPENRNFAVPKLEAYELASILLHQANPENPKHSTAWAKILKTVSVTGQYSVDIELTVPYVRPEALMNFPYREFSSNADDRTGPYVLGEQRDNVTTFNLNDGYPRSESQQYPQISEWLFASPSEAADALRRGLVDAVDRIPPSDLAKLRRDPEIEVRPYLIPTIHLLIPNFRNDFLKQATFRSGLLKAINREQILYNMLCNGVQIDGTVVIDGPFPIGSDSNQQISYGYNTRVTPVRYAQLIGAVLLEATRLTQETKLVEAGAKDPQVKMPTLILAHPQGDVPAVACRAIAQMWEIAGVKTELRELPPGVTVPEDGNYDFLYCELTIAEPLTDANFLFGTSGIVTSLSAPVEQMMRSVNVSNSWRAASNNLRQLHRQILNDVTVIPLWQMTEHFAFRRNVREIGRDLMFLYQFVDRWQIGPIRSVE